MTPLASRYSKKTLNGMQKSYVKYTASGMQKDSVYHLLYTYSIKSSLIDIYDRFPLQSFE